MKKILVIVNDSYLSAAVRLARDGYDVELWNVPFTCTGLPRVETAMWGWPNVKIVDDPFHGGAPGADAYVFFDIGLGGTQEFLHNLGYYVWGSGYVGGYEANREAFKLLLEELGYPVSPWRVFWGLEELERFAKDHPEQMYGRYIKLHLFRGTTETFHVSSVVNLYRYLQWLKLRVTEEAANRLVFVVEDPIPDAIEAGIDAWRFEDGSWPQHVLWGVEVKNRAYAGLVTPSSQCPVYKISRDVLEAMIERNGNRWYNGFYSTEIRITPDGKQYMLEPTLRAPSPPYQAYVSGLDNFSEIVLGHDIEGKWRNKYFVIAFANIDMPKGNPPTTELILPKELVFFDSTWQGITLEAGMFVNEMDSYVRVQVSSEGPDCGLAVIGQGQSFGHAYQNLCEAAAQVEAVNPVTVNIDAAEEAIGNVLELIND